MMLVMTTALEECCEAREPESCTVWAAKQDVKKCQNPSRKSNAEHAHCIAAFASHNKVKPATTTQLLHW
jgi:hypothetical protein